MSKLKLLSFIVFVVVVGAAVSLEKTAEDEQITNFEECIEAGYPIMESYPRQCMTLSGGNFTEEIEGVISLEGGKCEEHTVGTCPIELQCVVCPSCPECSSISCQNEAICKNMGFDDDWYEEIQSSQVESGVEPEMVN